MCDYVRKARPRDPVEPAVRFETPPGRQGQVDFETFTPPWGRRRALLVVLGHSRPLWLRFHRRRTMAVLIDGLESAFARFGGALAGRPCRRLGARQAAAPVMRPRSTMRVQRRSLADCAEAVR